MICPNCSTVNPENARFCISCGQPLPRICAVCGAIKSTDARFCNQCGSPLDAPVSIPQAVNYTERRNQNGGTPLVLTNAATPAEETTEQRRIVTILFADLTSSTSASRRPGPRRRARHPRRVLRHDGA